jgi:hypothetical protein
MIDARAAAGKQFFPLALRDDRVTTPAAPLCPVCTGVLIELRGFVRCTRCHFSMCAGCDGGGDWAAHAAE